MDPAGLRRCVGQRVHQVHRPVYYGRGSALISLIRAHDGDTFQSRGISAKLSMSSLSVTTTVGLYPLSLFEAWIIGLVSHLSRNSIRRQKNGAARDSAA